jgi:uncharacterized protein YbjT (DUF2867 family)
VASPELDVLVVGATGRQGSAVTHALLKGAHEVRALTRTLNHPAADAFRLRGARLAWSNIDDAERLEDVARGVNAIFAITTSRGHGPAAETRHGLALVELARRLDVQHFVFSSVIPAASLTGNPAWDSKHEIEQYLRASGVPFTIVCPAFFMESLTQGAHLDSLRRGDLMLPMPSTRKLQQIACADAARFVRAVLENRNAFVGRRIAIASDELTPIEMAATLARISGRRIRHVNGAHDDDDDATAALCAWLAEHGGGADVTGLRGSWPEVNWHTLDGWARRQDWRTLHADRV